MTTYSASQLRVGNIYVLQEGCLGTIFVKKPFLLLASTVHSEHTHEAQIAFAPIIKIREFQKLIILTKNRVKTCYLNLASDTQFVKLND